MVAPLFLVTGILLLGATYFALRRALRLSRLVNILPRLDVVDVRTAAAGLQLVRGRVDAEEPLRSPFHRRECVYYAYRIEEPSSRRRLATGKDWSVWDVGDQTGRARVEARAALIRSPHETVTELGRLDRLDDTQLEFLKAAGIDPKHLPRFRTLRIVEYTLEPGDEVHVLGAVEQNKDGKVFYRGRHSPLAVSPTRDAGLIPGLRNERLLFSVTAALFASFSLLFLVAAFA